MSTDTAIYQKLIGHRAQIEMAEASFSSGKMHHAWLLTGPTGIGKSLFARHLAAAIISYNDDQSALFGDKPAFSLSLDDTDPIVRQVLQNAHPDFLYISPLESDKNKSGDIKIEQIRALTPFFSHKSARAGWRVAIIDNLDNVNVQGANAMLKMVEEPPEKTVILLLAKSAGRVLPTIRSRCREVKFEALSAADSTQILTQFLPDADQTVLHDLAIFSGGSIGYALQVAQTDVLDLYEATCRILAKPQADNNSLLDVSGKWGGARSKALLPIAISAFTNLLSNAALKAANQPLPAKLLSCEQVLIDQMAYQATSHEISTLYSEVEMRLNGGARAYLDMPSVFMAVFDKIHSITHKN